MNLTRLMVLGTLASHGPQHGHQIRRTAEVTNVGEWGGVSVGALYRELKVMAGEGLVSELRTEQVGPPARTVYAVTDQGQVELSMLRERAIRDLRPGPDPIGVALTFSGLGDDPEELASWMAARRDMLAVGLREISADRERLLAKGHITPLVATVMRRSELMIEGELRWHEEFRQVVSRAWAGRRPRSPPGPRTAPSRPATAAPSRPPAPSPPTPRPPAALLTALSPAPATPPATAAPASGRRRGRSAGTREPWDPAPSLRYYSTILKIVLKPHHRARD